MTKFHHQVPVRYGQWGAEVESLRAIKVLPHGAACARRCGGWAPCGGVAWRNRELRKGGPGASLPFDRGWLTSRKGTVPDPQVHEPSVRTKIQDSCCPVARKGTLCDGLKKRYGLVHISPGQILRDEVKKETNLGLQARGA